MDMKTGCAGGLCLRSLLTNLQLQNLVAVLVNIADQTCSRAIFTFGRDLPFDQRLQGLSQFLAQLHAPLIKRVNAKDDTFDENAMLI